MNIHQEKPARERFPLLDKSVCDVIDEQSRNLAEYMDFIRQQHHVFGGNGNTENVLSQKTAYELADALYLAGHNDSGRRDYDPRATAEWQDVVDAIEAASMPALTPISERPQDLVCTIGGSVDAPGPQWPVRPQSESKATHQD